MKGKYIVAIATLFAVGACTAAKGEEAKSDHITRTTVPTLDLERYMGRWYEIARFDHRFERNLEHCEALYTLLPNGHVKVENSGTDMRTGKRRTSYGHAKMGDAPGKLRVSFFLWFYSDYNILALDGSYQWALVGSRSPNYLWILSRTPTLPRATLRHILNEATARGYDITKLHFVEQ